MKLRNRTNWMAPIFGLAVCLSVFAGGQHTTRTYFGAPGQGAYNNTPPVKYKHPWTMKIMGHRHCVTPQDQHDKFLRQHAIQQARAIAAANRLNWDHYNAHMKSDGTVIPTGCGVMGQCNSCNNCNKNKCNKGCKGGCGDACGNGCGNGCDKGCGNGCCGKGLIRCILSKTFRCNNCNNNAMGHYPVRPAQPSPHMVYPGMNREDALRYIEGFQYYPPNQLIRSPRDFHMMDVRYGIGQ